MSLIMVTAGLPLASAADSVAAAPRAAGVSLAGEEWLAGVLFLALAGLAIVLYWWRLRRAETRRHELEQRVQETTQELAWGTAQIERRTRELEALNAITAVVSRSLDLQKILSDALDKVLEVMDIDAGGIYLLDDGATELRMAAYRGFTPEYAAQIERLALGEMLSGRVALSGETLVAEDIPTDARFVETVAYQAGFHSAASAPLVSRGKVLGTLFVINRAAHEFSPHDVQLLTAIGQQIGVATENARLFRDTTRQVHALRTLNSASRVISSVLERDALLQALYEQITAIAAADFYLIALYEQATNEICIEINVDEGVFYPRERYALDRGLLKRVVHDRQPLRFHSLKEERAKRDIDVVPSGSPKVVHGWLGVPMLYGDKVVGAIIVGSYEQGAFDEGHEQILTSVANQAAVALENARLYSEAQDRAEEQAVLNRLGQALTARLDVEQVLDEAYEGASCLLDATDFYIALYDADKDQVTFALDVTRGELRKPHTTRKAGRGLTEYVIRTRAPLLLRDKVTEKLQELGVDMVGPVSFSWLGVPLMVGDRVLGVIATQSYTTPNRYNEHDRDLLTAIASPVAIAIQNAHLFEETQGRAERLALVNRIARAASSTLLLEELLETVYDEIVPAFRADAFFIALYDEKAQEVDFCFRVDEGVREPRERVPLGVGLSSIVIEQKKPLIIRNDEERSHLAPFTHPFGTMRPASSWLGAPLLVGDRVIGVISVQAYRPGAWGEQDELLLFTIADQVALAIENARFFQAEQRRAEQFRVIGEVGRRMTSILAADELLWQMARVIKTTLGYYLVGIAMIEGDKLVFKAGAGGVWETPHFHPPRLQVGREGITGWVAQSGEPLLVPDVSQEPRYYSLREASEIRSELAVPLKTKERVIGVMHVQSEHLRAFDGTDLVVLQSLAHQAAIAIQNAQLFARVEQHMGELEALYRADEELYRHLQLEQLLQTVVDVAVDLLHADKSGLLTWDARQERLVMRVARGFQPETLARMCFVRGVGAVGYAAACGETVVVEDAQTDLLGREEWSELLEVAGAEGICAFMHIPLTVHGEVFGVLNVSFSTPRALHEDERRIFIALAQRAALAIENAQLYAQAQELAVFQERQRLARDLHDAVTQTLFSASLIAEVLPALWEKNQEKAREYLKQLRQLSRGALAEMRTLLLELRPATLVDSRLSDLMRQLGDAARGQTGADVVVNADDDLVLPAEVHVAFYRVAQEALNNVVKHANASEVRLLLRGKTGPPDQRVTMAVSDDGRGFDLGAVAANHLGLGIMRERAAGVGARLHIDTRSGGGTVVTLSWPAEDV